MEQYFTKTFFKFFFSFLVIIGVAFGVIAVASSITPPPSTDIIANPELPNT